MSVLARYRAPRLALRTPAERSQNALRTPAWPRLRHSGVGSEHGRGRRPSHENATARSAAALRLASTEADKRRFRIQVSYDDTTFVARPPFRRGDPEGKPALEDGVFEVEHISRCVSCFPDRKRPTKCAIKGSSAGRLALCPATSCADS